MSAYLQLSENRSDNVQLTESKVRFCAVCKSENNLKRCSRCKLTFYCSREHQKENWIHHKHQCKGETTSSSPRQVQRKTESLDLDLQSDELNVPIHRPPHILDEDAHKAPDLTRDSSTQAEIDSILDFSEISSKALVPKTREEKQAIFFELAKSDSKEYCGPSENTVESYANIINTLTVPCSNTDSQHENSPEDEGASELNDSTPLFDSHPFRRLKFPKPDSYDSSVIADFISLRLTQLGYCILDSALEDDLIRKILSDMKKIRDNNEFRSGETLQPSDIPGHRSDSIKWTDPQREGLKYIAQGIAYIDSIVGMLQPLLNRYGEAVDIDGRTEVLLSCFQSDGSYFRRHVDNELKDGRRITCTLYLNDDWNVERDGGLLRMFAPKQEKPVDVPPLANRLVFYWSDGRMPYEVQPTYRDRYSMTVWYYDKEEKAKAKVEKLKEEADDIYQRIADLEEQRRQLQEMTSAQQIQNRAMEAVTSLSQGELQALSLLIDHHPDPKQALTAMGISEVVQEALIVYLSSQDAESNH